MTQLPWGEWFQKMMTPASFTMLVGILAVLVQGNVRQNMADSSRAAIADTSRAAITELAALRAANARQDARQDSMLKVIRRLERRFQNAPEKSGASVVLPGGVDDAVKPEPIAVRAIRWASTPLRWLSGPFRKGDRP